MDLIRFSIENPVKVAVGVILILLFGVISLTAIPIQLTPDVERPVVTVRTEWRGRSPEEIEESILIEQEEKLKTLQGLWKMTSTAELGRAMITLEFNVGFPITRALQEVASRLDEVREYPDDVDRPVIRASDSASDDAVAYGLLEAEDPDYEVARCYDFADRFVKPALERIPGVAEIGIFGGREHQVQVRFHPVSLAQRGITIDEFRNALRMDNVNESAGDMAHGRQDVRFRVMGQFESLEPLRRTIVKNDAEGVPIRVEDVADVVLDLEKKVYFDQCKGKTSMTVYVKRETGANVLDIMDDVRRVLAELNAPGGLLRSYKNDRYGLSLRLVADDTYYIHRSVGLVQENMVVGGGLAVLVLLLFLRSTRPTLIIAVAIPISVVGTFVVMALTGRNLNVISLAGLSFAVAGWLYSRADIDTVGAIDFVTTVAPGLRDVLLIGKVYEAVRRRVDGRRVYDAVVLDAPPTGRITRFLNVNREVAGLARVGPIHHHASSIMQLLRSPETAVHLVTVLEEMPVQETVDGVGELRAAGLPVGGVVVNLVRDPVLAAAELDAAADGLLDREAVAAGLETAGLGGRRVEDAGLPARVRVQTLADGLLVEAAEHGVRLRLGDRQFRRVEELGRPTYQVPALPCGIDLGALYELAERLRDQGLA